MMPVSSEEDSECPAEPPMPTRQNGPEAGRGVGGEGALGIGVDSPGRDVGWHHFYGVCQYGYSHDSASLVSQVGLTVG